VEVTGIAEPPSYRNNALSVWIKNGTEREKVDAAYRIYPSNPKNDALTVSIKDKMEAAAKLREEWQSLQQKLDPLVIAKEEESK
jgi:hypothetical protein